MTGGRAEVDRLALKREMTGGVASQVNFPLHRNINDKHWGFLLFYPVHLPVTRRCKSRYFWGVTSRQNMFGGKGIRHEARGSEAILAAKLGSRCDQPTRTRVRPLRHKPFARSHHR